MKIKIIEINLELEDLDSEAVDIINNNFWNLFQDDLIDNDPYNIYKFKQ